MATFDNQDGVELLLWLAIDLVMVFLTHFTLSRTLAGMLLRCKRLKNRGTNTVVLRGLSGMMTVNALVAADSGMADIVHIIEQSRNALVSGGFLLLEHGWQQGEAVRQAFILAGYHDVETCRDYGDNERVTLGRYYQ